MAVVDASNIALIGHGGAPALQRLATSGAQFHSSLLLRVPSPHIAEVRVLSGKNHLNVSLFSNEGFAILALCGRCSSVHKTPKVKVGGLWLFSPIIFMSRIALTTMNAWISASMR
ncbi:hypothetical protein ACLEDP_15675 [Lonsdalea quercina]|uniref:hypothetical protein n=1 Tax=Lonsdalea quercina TaxID=71657 RepID=UPI003974950B